MIKPVNLILFAILMLSNLVSVHAQEQNADAQKAILGKWKYVDMRVDVATSDSSVTARIEELFSVLNQTILTGEGAQLEVVFTEDGHVINNETLLFIYSVSENKLFRNKKDKTEELDYRIEGDSLTYSFDLSEEFYELAHYADDLNEDDEDSDNDPEFPEDLRVDKCIVSVYFSRVKGETEIN